jgi:hypothetical protein
MDLDRNRHLVRFGHFQYLSVATLHQRHRLTVRQSLRFMESIRCGNTWTAVSIQWAVRCPVKRPNSDSRRGWVCGWCILRLTGLPSHPFREIALCFRAAGGAEVASADATKKSRTELPGRFFLNRRNIRCQSSDSSPLTCTPVTLSISRACRQLGERALPGGRGPGDHRT